MNRRILLGMTFTLALVVLRASAFGQAAAESVLLNSGSAATTVKAGSALNSALKQGSKQLAGRVQQVVPPEPGKMSRVGARPVSASPVKDTVVRADTTPAQGDMITSIQGTVTSCASTHQTASTPGSKTGAVSAHTNCSGQDSASKPVPRKYKSVITLSLPK